MDYLEPHLKTYLFSFCDLQTLLSLSKTSKYFRKFIPPLLHPKRTKYYFSRDLNPGLEAVKRDDLKYFLALEKSGYLFSKCVLPRILLLQRKEFLKASSISPLSSLHVAHCIQSLVKSRNQEMIELFKGRMVKTAKPAYPILVQKDSLFITSYFPGYDFRYNSDYNLLTLNFDVELYTMSRYRKEYKSRLIIEALASCDPEIVDFVLANVSKGKFLDICIWNEYHLEIDYPTVQRIVRFYEDFKNHNSKWIINENMSLSKITREVGGQNLLNRTILNMFIASNKFFIQSLAENGWHPEQKFLEEPFELEYYPSSNGHLVTKINRVQILNPLKSIVQEFFPSEEAEKIIQKIEQNIPNEMEI